MHVLVVGGSYGGLASGLSLLRAGAHRVDVFERSETPLARGAGVGLDDVAVAVLRELLAGTKACTELGDKLQPLRLIEERVASSGSVLLRQAFPYSAAYWEDAYRLLMEGFVEAGGHLHFNKKATTLTQEQQQPGQQGPVTVTFEDGTSASGDLLVAADGPRSSLYPQMFPRPQELLYRGYSALRGTFLRAQLPEGLEASLAEEFPDLGNCLYAVMGPAGRHMVLCELAGGFLNWLVYLNQPQPFLADAAQTTGVPTPELLEELHGKAEEVWGPGLGGLMRATTQKIVNDMYDRDPPQALVSGRVVLLGDAAHPITPHCAKGACLALHDAYVLGEEIREKLLASSSPNSDGEDAIAAGLAAYERRRLPEVTRMVLHSRHTGAVRNCISTKSRHLQDFGSVTPEEYSAMLEASAQNMDWLPLDTALRKLAGGSADP